MTLLHDGRVTLLAGQTPTYIVNTSFGCPSWVNSSGQDEIIRAFTSPALACAKVTTFFSYIETLAQVDSAERMTLIPGKTFLLTN